MTNSNEIQAASERRWLARALTGATLALLLVGGAFVAERTWGSELVDGQVTSKIGRVTHRVFWTRGDTAVRIRSHDGVLHRVAVGHSLFGDIEKGDEIRVLRGRYSNAVWYAEWSRNGQNFDWDFLFSWYWLGLFAATFICFSKVRHDELAQSIWVLALAVGWTRVSGYLAGSLFG
jgi:hypothetical protein